MTLTRGETDLASRPVLTSTSLGGIGLGLQVRCMAIRTRLAQLVVFGGEVVAFSRLVSVVS